MNAIKEKVLYAVVLTFITILIGTFVYRSVENWGWVDSTYFAVSTLTTVGFGDLHPTHTASRIFTIIYMLIGISIMLYTVTLIGAYSVESRFYSKPFDIITRRKPHQVEHKTEKESKLTKEIDTLIEKLTAKTHELEDEQDKNGKTKPRYKNKKENN